MLTKHEIAERARNWMRGPENHDRRLRAQLTVKLFLLNTSEPDPDLKAMGMGDVFKKKGG